MPHTVLLMRQADRNSLPVCAETNQEATAHSLSLISKPSPKLIGSVSVRKQKCQYQSRKGVADESS